MNRETRRKEEKKKKNIKKTEELDTSIRGITILKVIGAVVLILLILYYILAVFVTKEIDISTNKNNDSSQTNNNSTTSVSNKILAAKTFDQTEEVYYVYFYNFTDEDQSISSALTSKSDWKIYRVDTSSSLNSNYVSEDNGNPNAKGIEELKVKTPTLIQITNEQITGYYEGSSNIITFLS